jgi:hypothetical protein
MGIRAACSALTLLQVLFEITDALVTGFRTLAVAARIGTQLPAPILRRKFLCSDGTKHGLDVSRHVEQPSVSNPMRSFVALTAGALVAASTLTMPAARADMTNTVPSSSLTVTDWYKQDVYDQSNTKIGQVADVLVSQDGQINALIIGVGGFLGAGEKDVAASFNTVKATKKDNKNYLTMNTTKDALKAAPAFKYDRDKTVWVPDTNPK